MSLQAKYKNMQTSLNYNVSLEWLLQFEDILKLKFLNRLVAKPNDRLNNCDYISFIEKYYHDKRFNLLYNNCKNFKLRTNGFSPSIKNNLNLCKY